MTQIDIDEEIFIYLHFKISTNTSNILYRIPLKSLTMENDSEDRSNLVEHDVNNVKGKKSYFCQPRKTQEWGERFFRSKNLTTDWQKERKKVENRKFLLVEKIQFPRQRTLPLQQKRKRKPNIGEITNRHLYLPRISAIQVPMRNYWMMGLKLSLKMNNLNGNYPDVWPTKQRNILKSKFQRIFWKFILCQSTSKITLIMLRS